MVPATYTFIDTLASLAHRVIQTSGYRGWLSLGIVRVSVGRRILIVLIDS